MPDKGQCKSAKDILLTLAAITAGLGLICYAFDSYRRDYPERKKGDLGRCEQVHVCPGARARDGNVLFKGTGLGFTATLTNGLPEISPTTSRGQNDFNNDGVLVSYNSPFKKMFHLVKGSTVSWDIYTLNSIKTPDFYFYKKEKENCVHSGSCNANVEHKQISIFTNSYTVLDSGDYIAEVSFGEEMQSEETYLSRCRFTVKYTRYLVEEDEVEHTDSPLQTFKLPGDGAYYGCVFVENPCSNLLNNEIEFNLEYKLNEDDRFIRSRLYFTVGVLLLLFGVIGFIMAINVMCCKCCVD